MIVYVHVLDQNQQCVRVCCAEAARGSVEAKIAEVLAAMKKKRLTRHCHNSAPALQAKLLEQTAWPPYWVKYSGNSAKLLFQLQPSLAAVSVDGTDLHESIKEMMSGTRSRCFFSLARIENPVLYEKYQERQRVACEAGLRSSFAHITHTSHQKEVATAEAEVARLDAMRMRELNEYFLYLKVARGELEKLVTQGINVKEATFTEAESENLQSKGNLVQLDKVISDFIVFRLSLFIY
jgi:hypothetical protein